VTKNNKPSRFPGTDLLTRKLSADEQTDVDLRIQLDAQQRYDEWLAALPIPKRDQDLVRDLDYLRRTLLAGVGIDPKVAAAIKAGANRGRKKIHKQELRRSVDFLHRTRGLPKTIYTTDGPGAFERAGELFGWRTAAGESVSAEQVRKIYYERKPPKKT